MSRKDGVYKLACEWAKINGTKTFTAMLAKHKASFKTGKADALLEFYMEGVLSSRTGEQCLVNFLEYENISGSFKGYKEIREAFCKGISNFDGTIYYRKGDERRDDFELYGPVKALIVNNPSMSASVIIKTNEGRQIVITEKNEKAKLFVIKANETLLPYNIRNWPNSSIKYLTSGTAIDPNINGGRRRDINGEERVERLTPLELFLSSRKMNLYPSRGQLAKINKQKLKVFGDLQEVVEYDNRGRINIRYNPPVEYDVEVEERF